MRNETAQCQGSLDERDSWHSVGHLPVGTVYETRGKNN